MAMRKVIAHESWMAPRAEQQQQEGPLPEEEEQLVSGVRLLLVRSLAMA